MLQLLSTERFHYHQASVREYIHANEGHSQIIRVFYSYDTPILIALDGVSMVLLDEKISTSTSRQINRYLNENNIIEGKHYIKYKAEKFRAFAYALGLPLGVLL